MELNEILQALKNLTDEEKAKVMEALEEPSGDPPAESAEGEPSADETSPEEGKEGGEPEAQAAPAEAQAEPDAGAEAPSDDAGEPAGQDTEESNSAAPPEENAGDIGGGEEEIPAMTAEPQENMTEEPQAEQETALADEQGGEMPVDYQQIIDGLNAKNLALEAENRQLKAKIEGAFGLTGKPGGLAKVNPLYDDANDIPPMRKPY